MTSIFPSSQNKETFKAYLRTYKDKFSDNILSAKFEQISNMMIGYHNSLTNDTNIEVLLFDYNDTINVSNTGNFLYIPGLENDVINLTNGSTTKSLKVKSNGVEVDGSTYTLGTHFDIGDQSYIVWGLGGILLNAQTVSSGPSYTVLESSTTVNEGSSVTFTINTLNVTDATTLYWSLGVVSGNITTNDFTTSSTGTVIINNDTGSVVVNIRADATTEGSEEFVLQLRTDSSSGTVVATSSNITIGDTSLTPAFTATPSRVSISELESVTITVDTVNVADGTSLTFNAPSTDVTPYTGSFTINNNTGSFTLTALQDLDVETNQTVNVQIYSSSLVAQTSFVIVDVPYTITATPSTTLITESSTSTPVTMTVTITTTDVPDGTILTVHPSLTLDITPSVQSVTITNNTATTGDFTITRDGLTEGPEIFKFLVRNSNNNQIAETPEITIVDSSYTGKNFDNKTFGPISVNRDNGNSAAASDWYTICGLDNIPDGSEIAVFIDGSGSMTQATVQASLDLLLSKLQPRNITITTVTNSNEDWITPFDTGTI